MVITMLKSVVDSSPILFVRIGQQSVGAIDFKLQASATTNKMISGNRNFYGIDPFDNPYAVKRDSSWPFDSSTMQGENLQNVEKGD